jgi:hypothetical protein
MQLVHSGPVLTHRLASGAHPAGQQVATAGVASSAYATTIASLRYRIPNLLRSRGVEPLEDIILDRFGRVPPLSSASHAHKQLHRAARPTRRPRRRRKDLELATPLNRHSILRSSSV